MSKRIFSLYDIEEFLREAGAEKINERAIINLEQELENTVKEIVDEAKLYANYAGRTKLIKSSDIRLCDLGKPRNKIVALTLRKREKKVLKIKAQMPMP